MDFKKEFKERIHELRKTKEEEKLSQIDSDVKKILDKLSPENITTRINDDSHVNEPFVHLDSNGMHTFWNIICLNDECEASYAPIIDEIRKNHPDSIPEGFNLETRYKPNICYLGLFPKKSWYDKIIH